MQDYESTGTPSTKERDISISALMAILNSKTHEVVPKKKALYDRPPPLPSLNRPHPPIYPLTLMGNNAEIYQDPIKAYRKKDYPYLQLFENGIAVFPNFAKSIPLPRSPPLGQAKKENIRKVLAWKYGMANKEEKPSIRDYDVDTYIKKPKRHRFSKYPARQMFYVRTGLAFPIEYKSYKHSFDKPETLQPFYANIHDYTNKARRFLADMTEFEDSELTFIVEGNYIEIFGTKKQAKTGNFRQTVEKITLPGDLHIEKVHFIRDYQHNIIVEEKWEV